MSEQAKLNEQELEKVTGGTGDDGFEAAWAAYTSANCGDCMFIHVYNRGKGDVLRFRKAPCAAGLCRGPAYSLQGPHGGSLT